MTFIKLYNTVHACICERKDPVFGCSNYRLCFQQCDWKFFAINILKPKKSAKATTGGACHLDERQDETA